MADLRSQAVTQLSIRRLVPINYQRTIWQNIVDEQTLMIKALQADIKTLEARITELEP